MPILDFVSSVCDTPLFKSVVNKSHQTIMGLLQDFRKLTKGHYPNLNKYIDIIIANNQKANTLQQDSKDIGAESLENSKSKIDKAKVQNVVRQRTSNDRTIDKANKDKDKGLLPPENQKEVDQAWNDSRAMKFRDEVRDKMKSGTQDKLDEAARRKLEDQARARNEQLEKDRRAKEEMVRLASSGKTAEGQGEVD